MSDVERHSVFDINTISNYDRDIVPFLDAEMGRGFERDADGIFRRLKDDEE
jgi:hypothetical protein